MKKWFYITSHYVIDIFDESVGFIMPHQASQMMACHKYLLNLGQSDGDTHKKNVIISNVMAILFGHLIN